jgi:nucleoid-associated protein YgaU/two-component SAPR family response regulator
MSPSTSKQFGARVFAQLLAAAATITAIVGLPMFLGAAARQRFHHVSPLHGMNAPWRWSVDDVRAWSRRLTEGLDSSAALVDLFLRFALVVGWICVVIVLYTVIDEMVFQLRHGMPSARRHHLAGLGPLGRKLATVLVAVLPLAVSATPTLGGLRVAGAVAGVVQQRVADLPEPSATELAMPIPALTSATTANMWSVVEVKRGDSIWAIAERFADGGDVAAIADQIVAANVGTMMSDGHRFSTPALIEPGWLLNVPVAVSTSTAAASDPVVSRGDYLVVSGDSYWAIAERHLDVASSDADVARYTSELMTINAPRLGYTNDKLIRPGDVLQLSTYESSVVPRAPTPAQVPTVVPVPVLTVPIDAVSAPASPAAAEPGSAGLPPQTGQSTAPSSSPLTSPSPTPSHARIDNWSNDGIPVKRGLAAAVLLAGGAIAVLGSRRRQQLRSAHVGSRLLSPTDGAIETETLLRSLTPADQLARIDLALRCASPDLARQKGRVLAVEVADDGEIRLYTDRPAMLVPDHWVLDVDAGAWRLPARVTLSELARCTQSAGQPCPAILHLGESAGGQLFVDLEAVGVLSIDAAPEVAASIVRCAAASLAVSPFVESSRVFTVGIESEAHLGNPCVESLVSVGAAVEAVTATVGSITVSTSGDTTTFALRAAAGGGEAWEPAILLAIGVGDPEELAPLVWRAGTGGRGIGVMIDRPVVGCGALLRAVEGDFVFEPLGRRVTPVGLSASEVSAVSDLLDAAEQPLVADVVETGTPVSSRTEEFAERQHEIVVQLLGPVAVQSAGGALVAFDRSKAQELVVWLSQHRHRPTRTSARTALWDLTVRDATFSNVVSDARRAMAKIVTPPDGQEWIARTMNEELPLHDLVVSDVELLADRVAAARGFEALAAIAILRPAVALIQGMPFAGTSYLWPDAEGITSGLVLLATSAAAELAAHYLATGDIDGVFWATGQGLKVLAGHEELIALRMRAHAYRGDLAGVRIEWDSYERAVNADTWAAAQPSPKLVELRRELLAPTLAS